MAATRNAVTRWLVPLGMLACLMPWVHGWMALLAGVAVGLAGLNTYRSKTRAWTPKMMAYTIVGLGAGMNLVVVLEVGQKSLVYSALGIVSTMTAGFLLGRVFKTDRIVTILLSAGTAICGGSAIAALSPVVGARDEQMAMSLAIVFCLNAFALLIFPPIGYAVGMMPADFGLWSALAIHDTSSVVAASAAYGPEALEVATSAKLVRALWIIPLVVFFQILGRRRADANVAVPKKMKYPWFILGFVTMATVFSLIPEWHVAGDMIATLSKQILVCVLFLIGANITRDSFRELGGAALLHGVTLWALVSLITFWVITAGWIGA